MKTLLRISSYIKRIGLLFGICISLVACGNTTAKENSEIADFSIQTLVCYGNFAADIQNDGTVRITVIGDGALEINLEEVASWKNPNYPR